MSAISDAAFEKQMEAANAGEEEKLFFRRWHQTDPTKSFGELRERLAKTRAAAPAAGFGPHGYKLYPCARICGNFLELGGVCPDCNKADEARRAFMALPRCISCRAYKDSAEEPCKTCDPSVLAAALRPAPVAGVYECYICQKEGPEPACAPCRQAMDAFGAVQCAHCEAYWLGAFDGEWEYPCGQCHPDYRAAYAARNAPAPVPVPVPVPVPAVNPESEDEDMGWYNEKKKEWAAYADALEAEEAKETKEDYD